MPVSIPTAADVRKAREQAAERAEAARTPLLAVLGAGDYAYSTVTKAVVEARTRATAQAEEVQHRVAVLPQRLSPEALRDLVAELRADAEERYGYFARRGESTWGKLRKQPQVKQAIATIETYTEKLDERVDVLVDDAHDAAEKALAAVTRQTRSVGERTARATQRAAAETAEAVAETAETVAEAGEDAAAAIAETGDEAAAETRSVSRKAANRTAPKAAPKTAPKTEPKTGPKTAPKTAPKTEAKVEARKPAARRTANGTASGS